MYVYMVNIDIQVMNVLYYVHYTHRRDKIIINGVADKNVIGLPKKMLN